MRERLKWTTDEDDAVIVLTASGAVPARAVRILAAKLGRTPRAVRDRMRHLKCDGIQRSPWLTIRKLAQQTHYGESRIHTAIERLGVKIAGQGRTKTGRVKFWMIPAAAVSDIIRECGSAPDGGLLTASRHGEWGRRGKFRVNPPACLRCGTSERPHASLGYCLRCYSHNRDARERALRTHEFVVQLQGVKQYVPWYKMKPRTRTTRSVADKRTRRWKTRAGAEAFVARAGSGYEVIEVPLCRARVPKTP